jgi:ATP-dependent Lon protease
MSDNLPYSDQPKRLPVPTIKPQTIPVVAIRDVVLFPHTEPTLTFGRPKSMTAIQTAHQNQLPVCLVTQKNTTAKDPQFEDLYHIGVKAEIERLVVIENIIHAIVKATQRIKLTNLVAQEPFFLAEYQPLDESIQEDDELKALANHLTSQFKKAVNLGKSVDLSIFMRLMSGVKINELADQIAYTLDIDIKSKQDLLTTINVNERLQKIVKHLAHEIKILELEYSIFDKTQKRMDKSMHEAILRERKKTIEKELERLGPSSKSEGTESEINELAKKIKQAGMSDNVREKAEKELKRLAQMSVHNPERSYLQNYLDWLVAMPWNKSTEHKIELKEAIKILDNDHYGLKNAKERIIEYLAVMKLRQQANKQVNQKIEESKNKKINTKQQKSKTHFTNGATILCFVGPPGVGKTSIGKSIAKALGRKFVRMSLGGIRDEAEIRGHRRTYIGALPGRIIQGIKNAGSNNPVFMLDEIDKLGTDFRGDPSSALLEALDPEQNNEFSDHYLEVPFDLSQVMFITTANLMDPIPPALKDRLEVIEFRGYTEEEKLNIAQKYLWPKQLQTHALPKECQINESSMQKVIHHYTREAGVRDLERQLANICRKIARHITENHQKSTPDINSKQITKYLGPIKYRSQLADKKDEIGVTTGLAYTPVGGNILFIEVAIAPGKGKLTLTGHLGQVMQESCKAAFSYIRTRWKELGLPKNFTQKIDVHIHVPEGAVPKDGPSAGAAIATALTSAITQTPSKRTVAMTGEITLRGRVTEIGGLKEKVIAAHRAGIKTIILPKGNKNDLREIPSKIQKDIHFVFAEHLDEVLSVALHPLKTKPTPNLIKPKFAHSYHTHNGHPALPAIT